MRGVGRPRPRKKRHRPRVFSRGPFALPPLPSRRSTCPLVVLIESSRDRARGQDLGDRDGYPDRRDQRQDEERDDQQGAKHGSDPCGARLGTRASRPLLWRWKGRTWAARRRCWPRASAFPLSLEGDESPSRRHALGLMTFYAGSLSRSRDPLAAFVPLEFRAAASTALPNFPLRTYNYS